MEELFRTFPTLLEKLEESDEFREAVIRGAWKKIAGSSLSDHTAALGLQGSTLEVAVRDNIWKRHLESLAGQMIFKLNSLLGTAAVTYIEFRIDEPAVAKAKHDDSQAAEAGYPGFERVAAEQRTEMLVSAAGQIKDPALRSLFLDAASNCLARKKFRTAQ